MVGLDWRKLGRLQTITYSRPLALRLIICKSAFAEANFMMIFEKEPGCCGLSII